jgi:hypothetical protein
MRVAVCFDLSYALGVSIQEHKCVSVNALS